ncbi:hypothetical protein L915_01408, partial [Phytophthora nicotianae]
AWKERESKYTHDDIPHKRECSRRPEEKRTVLMPLADRDDAYQAYCYESHGHHHLTGQH